MVAENDRNWLITFFYKAYEILESGSVMLSNLRYCVSYYA